MNQPIWQLVESSVRIDARPAGGLWTVAVEYVTGPRKLRIASQGEWQLRGDQTCGPDGDERASGGSAKCLSESAPRGCLLAKIGGGTADLKGQIVPVGRFAVIELADPATVPTALHGTLFLTMNDEPAAFQGHGGQLTVDIWEAP